MPVKRRNSVKRGSARCKRKSATVSRCRSGRRSVKRSKSPRKASGRRKSARASLSKLSKHVKSLEAHVEKTHRPGVSKKSHDKDFAAHKQKYHANTAQEAQVDEARQSMGYYFADLAVYYAKMAKLFSDK
jgi:hypothetical protein